MITAKYLVDYVKKAAADKWGYVAAGQGEMYSLELANTWAATRKHYSKYYYVTQCKRWFGHYVADCSGLIISAFRAQIPKYMDQTADYLYSHSSQGKISNMPEIPGICVWKKGHIGIYIGNGLVVEARGYAYGVVTTKVKDRPWTGWGKLADVDYLESEDTDVLQKGDKNELVGKWQENLIKTGYKLPKYGADSDFGTETLTATNEFKADAGLAQNGIVDGEAWAEMSDMRASVAGDEADSLQADVDLLTSKINAAKSVLA